MQSLWKTNLVAGSVMLAFSGCALAQTSDRLTAPARSPAVGQALLYGADQFPLERGTVRQFTLTPRGDIDGLILTDGTEVDTAPYLSTQIAYAITPGDRVTVHGLHAAALRLVRAVSITDARTGRTVIDNGRITPGPNSVSSPPPPPPRPPAASSGAPITGLIEVQGRVRMALHGPQGEVNGVLLDDGTTLRLPPPEAYRLASLLQPGRTIVAEGSVLATAMGKVMDAREIGASPKKLSLVEAPLPPGPGPGLRPPPPAPGPGPPGPPVP